MNIQFKTIRFKNFLSYGDEFTEISLCSNQLTVLLGQSGSGKSTLLDALAFAIYNRPFRDINKAELINSVNKTNCVVEIEFETNGVQFKVVRGMKPAIFEIYRDGQLIDQSADSRDYQDYLETQVLRCNYKSFIQIVMLGAANFVPFMRLKTADRRTIIEELLDIQIFSVMNGLLKEFISQNNEKIREAKTELSMIDSAIISTEGFIQKVIQQNMEQKKRFEDNIESITNEVVDLQGKILKLELEQSKLNLEKQDEVQAVIEKIKSEISTHEKTLVELRMKYKQIDSEFVSRANLEQMKIDSEFTKKKNECYTLFVNLENGFQEKIKEVKNTLATEKRLLASSYKEKSSVLEEKINFYSSVGAECPTCKQTISDETKSQIVADCTLELKNLKESIATKLKELEDASDVSEYNKSILDIQIQQKEAIAKINDEMNQALSLLKETTKAEKAAALKSINDEASIVTAQIESLKTDVEQHQEKIKKIQLVESAFQKLKTQLDLKEHSLEIAKQNLVSFVYTGVDDEKEKLVKLNDKKTCQVKLLEEEENLSGVYQKIQLLLKDTGIKSRVIKQYIPVINASVNKFLSWMNFFVTFEIDEDFKEIIRSRGRDEFSYCNFSEGERQRIDIALLFAWRTVAKMRNSMNTNLLILDEVLDSSLDEETTINALRLLRGDVFSDANIFVITHKPQIAEHFDKVISYQKVGNFSEKVVD